MGPYFKTSQLAKLFDQAFYFYDQELFTLLAVKACLLSGKRVQDVLLVTLQGHRIPKVRELTIVFKAVARLTQLSEILTMLKHSSTNVRWAAVNTFAYYGNRDHLHLLEAMSSDEDATVRKQAAEAISTICNRSFDPFVNNKNLPRIVVLDPMEEAIARLILGEPETISDVSVLLSLLTDRYPMVAEWVTQALVSRKPSTVIQYIGARVQQGGPIDLAEINALRAVGDANAIALLIQCLRPTIAWWPQEKKTGIRNALRHLGKEAANALLEAFMKDSWVRSHEGRLLAEVAGTPALQALLAALGDPLRAARCNAEEGLKALGPMSVFPLLAALDNMNRDGVISALRVLGEIGAPEGVEAIVSKTKSADPDISLAAIGALAKFDNRQTLEILIDALASPRWQIRKQAVEVLGYWSWVDVDIVNLLESAADDSHARVRGAVGESSWRLLQQGNAALWQKLELRHQRERTMTAGEDRSDIVKERLAYVESRPDHPDPNIPKPITDEVHFSVVGPRCVKVRQTFLLNVWAHPENVQDLISLEGRGEAVRIGSKGPVPVDRGAVLTVRLSIPAFQLEDEDTIYWSGTKGNANFPVTVPETARDGDHFGLARFFAGGFQIARLSFLVRVSTHEDGRDDLTSSEYRARSAFASYSSEDRDEVLGRIQGMLKVFPDLDIFLDVASLRSGEDWQQRLEHEIMRRDVFYLFWSCTAAQSKWIDWEWRTALRTKGIDYIDPVPLEPPDRAPPPAELSKLHFNEWTLHYRQ